MSHHTAQEIRVINHWTVASLQREVKQFSPVLAVQACAGYFVISVLNAEIITFVKTLYFISHKISTSHTTCYSVCDYSRNQKPFFQDQDCQRI